MLVARSAHPTMPSFPVSDLELLEPAYDSRGDPVVPFFRSGGSFQ